MNDLITAIVILIVLSIGIAFWAMMWIFTGWIGLTLVIALTVATMIYLYNDDVEGNI